MAGRILYWERSNLKRKQQTITETLMPVPIDKDFWRVWRDNPKAMRAAGYVLRKERGEWKAYARRMS